MLWFVCSVAADDAQEILEKVDRNLAPESYEMYRKLINVEPDGAKKEFVLYTAKKGRDNMLALFLAATRVGVPVRSPADIGIQGAVASR